MIPPIPSGASQSRSNSTYSAASVRPRNKRFITGLEGFSPDSNGAASNGAVSSPSPNGIPAYDSPYFPRAPSPIPATHPSRTSSLKPPLSRGASSRDPEASDLAASLSGLWGKSWTSLQELASTVLGNEGQEENVKGNTKPPKRTTPGSSRLDGSHRQWGPPPTTQTQPGGGSRQERSALLRARKRDELLSGIDIFPRRIAASVAKRRTSDDFNSTSAPAAESDDRDVLIYIHHVSLRDTMAGISIKYNCQVVIIKKINRLWSNDGIQARKTLMIPVDCCTIRGRRVSGPSAQETDLLTGDASTDEKGKFALEPSLVRRSSSSTITPSSISSSRNGSASNSPPPAKSEPDHPWTHDSWIMLDGQTEPIEIGRLPRSNLGYFPRPRRKSELPYERSSTSLDTHRPSISISDTSSSGKTSLHLHRSRRSSGSNQFASQMLGPGGVGSLKGKGPSTPGPSEDKITKVLRKGIPGIKTPIEEDYFGAGSTSPGMDFGNTVEGWARKFSIGISKAFDSNQARQQRRTASMGTTTSGDLIELANSFEIGEDDEEEEDNYPTPRNGYVDRGRRNSPVRSNGLHPEVAADWANSMDRGTSQGWLRKKGE